MTNTNNKAVPCLGQGNCSTGKIQVKQERGSTFQFPLDI